MKVLFLFESPLPKEYYKYTASPGELRVIAAQTAVKEIIVIGRSGRPFYDLPAKAKTKTPLEKKINIFRVPGTGNLLWYYLSPIWLFLAGLMTLLRIKVDIIHAESPHLSGVPAVILGKLFRIPVVVEYRASYEQIINSRLPQVPMAIKSLSFNLLSQFSLGKCDFILANSSAYQKELIAQGYSNVDWYGPGVRRPKNFKLRKHSEVTIGFIGRLYPDKGADYFIRSIALVKKKLRARHQPRKPLGLKVLIAGDGPQKKFLEDLVIKSGLQSMVKFLGTQPRWDFFSRIDILVNPNIILNALEMVNAEASAVGIPVITFGNQDRPVTVINGRTGIVVENLNISQMAEAIINLAFDSKLRAAYGRQGKKLAQNLFSFENQVKRLRHVYARLADPPRT